MFQCLKQIVWHAPLALVLSLGAVHKKCPHKVDFPYPQTPSLRLPCGHNIIFGKKFGRVNLNNPIAPVLNG